MDEILKTISTLDEIKIDIDEDLELSKNGISLLALKNQSLLAYLHHLVLIIAGMLERAQKDEIEANLPKSVENSIIHRVVLEKGVKSLESKIAYQIEKVLRAYLKTKKDEPEVKQAMDSEDEEALSYKPNPSAFSGSKERESSQSAKYEAPKISAVTPFTDREKSQGKRPKNAAMEEYLEHASGAPTALPSIGSTIMDSGRGGERTEKERRKQKEIQDFEETNYTRLPGMSKKEQKRAARQRQRDASGKNLFGEDWGFLDTLSKGDGGEPRNKRRKISAWEKAKKRAG